MIEQATIYHQIRELIAEMMEEEPESIRGDAHLVKDLGADSMSVLELMAALEKKFQIVIEPDHFPELVTLESSTALVEKLLNGAS